MERRMRMEGCRLPLPPLRQPQPEPLGMSTPPIHLPGSVPFSWEEAPGKPKKELRSLLSAAKTPRRLVEMPVVVEKVVVGGGKKVRGVSPGRNGKMGRKEGGTPSSLSSSSSSTASSESSPKKGSRGGAGISCGEQEKGRFSRLSRSLSVPHPSSHWLANIYGNLKMAVQRRKDKVVIL